MAEKLLWASFLNSQGAERTNNELAPVGPQFMVINQVLLHVWPNAACKLDTTLFLLRCEVLLEMGGRAQMGGGYRSKLRRNERGIRECG